MTQATVNSNTDSNITPTNILLGLAAGAVSCLCYTIYVRMATPTPLASNICNIISFVVTIGLFVAAGIIPKRKQGGYISLKAAFRHIFVVALISTVIIFVYNIVYVKYIDPTVIDRMNVAFINAMRQAHNTEAEINKTIQDQATGIAENSKFSNQAMSLAIQIVQKSLLGFICAFIIKKEKP